METNESIIELFHLGDSKPDQPPRFAKVVSVSGDTVTVTLGASNVDAVRCCDCAADDVVLLETLPSGQLAAVGVKGYNGGGGGGSYSAGTGLTLNGSTFDHSNAVTAGWIGSSLATSGNIIKMPYAQFDAQGHITNKGTIDHTSWNRSTPWLLGDAFVNDQQAIYQWPYINVLNNGMYSIISRGATVTLTVNGNTVSATASNLFDGNYDSHPGANFVLGAGDVGVVTIDFSTTATGHFPETNGGYPEGNLFLSFYYKCGAASVSARGYTDYYSVGWRTLTVTELKRSTQTAAYEGTKWQLDVPSALYNLKTLEITITGKASGTTPAGTTLTEIDYNQYRPNVYTHPYIGKYAAETLYHRLTGPYFRGVFEGNSVWYGTCGTAEGTAAKVVNCSGFVLATGAVIHVQCTSYNSVSGGITLNVNGTGAKTVYKCNAATSSSNGLCWWTGDVVSFIYDGTYWRFIGNPHAIAGQTKRLASANLVNGYTGDCHVRHFLATSSMTTGKPSHDGHILHMAWDNYSGYGAQLFLSNGVQAPSWRCQGANSWAMAWDEFYTHKFPPAFADITGTAAATQIPIDGVTITNVGGYLVASGVGDVVTTDSGGDTKEDVLAGTDVGEWHSGWREEKHSDGRLTKWKWQRYSCSSGFNALSTGLTAGTAFTGRPDVSVTVGPLLDSSFNPRSGYYVQGGVQDFTNNTTCVVGAQCGLAGLVFVEIRMDGFWA